MTTTLAKKLGIKEGQRILLLNEPKYYFNLFIDFPDKTINGNTNDTSNIDFIHLFAKNSDELNKLFVIAKPLLKKNAMLWISWPKKTSKMESDLDKIKIMNYGLSNGLVDVKVASINNDWSALKFVYRLKDR